MTDMEACVDDVQFTEDSVETTVEQETEEGGGQGQVGQQVYNNLDTNQDVALSQDKNMNIEVVDCSNTTSQVEEKNLDLVGKEKEVKMQDVGDFHSQKPADKEGNMKEIEVEGAKVSTTIENRMNNYIQDDGYSARGRHLESQPSFLKPTLSLLAPKLIEKHEDFPDSPASKRGIMMKTTGGSISQSQFDSIFLYDDKVKDKGYKELELLKDMKKKEELKNIPRLFRPTESKLALLHQQAQAQTMGITKRGTMAQSTPVHFTSKFALLIQQAEQLEIDKANKKKKDPIPHEAFEDAVLPEHKGHVFDVAPSPKKSPLPHEAFSGCVPSPLKERIRKAASLQIQELPPRVMKPAIPFDEFVASPVKPPPVVDSSKPITSLHELNRITKKKVSATQYAFYQVHSEWLNIINSELQLEIDITKAEWENEIQTIAHFNRATPQRRLYNRTLHASQGDTASALRGHSALTAATSNMIPTEQEVLRTKKLMQASMSTELNHSRSLMNHAKLHCAKGVASLQAYASEATDLVRKLFNRYISVVQKAASRSSDAYNHFVLSQSNYDKLIGPSPQKSTQQKRLHAIVNQQSTIMCTSLQSVEDIASTLKELRESVQKERKSGDYSFHEANPIHFFPLALQKFFSNPLQSPSKMKLAGKKLPKKKKRVPKKKAPKPNNYSYPHLDDDIFALSDEDDEEGGAHPNNNNKDHPPPEVIVRDAFVDEAVPSVKRPSVVSRNSFSEPMSVSSSNISLRDLQSTETIIRDQLCLSESVQGANKRSIVVSRQSFTDHERPFSGPNVSRKGRTVEQQICEQDVLLSPENVTRKGGAGDVDRGKTACWEDTSYVERESLPVLPSRKSVIVFDQSEEKGSAEEKWSAKKEVRKNSLIHQIRNGEWVQVLPTDGSTEVYWCNEIRSEAPAVEEVVQGMLHDHPNDTAEASRRKELVRQLTTQFDEELTRSKSKLRAVSSDTLEKLNESVTSRGGVITLMEVTVQPSPPTATNEDESKNGQGTLEKSRWVEVHESDGEVFYYNEATDESCWDKPADFESSPPSVRMGDWVQIQGNETSDSYWMNEVTGELKNVTPELVVSDDDEAGGNEVENSTNFARRRDMVKAVKAAGDVDLVFFKLELLKKSAQELELLAAMASTVHILRALQSTSGHDVPNGDSPASHVSDSTVAVPDSSADVGTSVVGNSTRTKNDSALILTESKSGRLF